MKQTFLVDIKKTMTNFDSFMNESDRQKLFCRCGATQIINAKIKKSIIKNQNNIIEDEDSIDDVFCDNCMENYKNSKSIFFLDVDNDNLFHVEFYREKYFNNNKEEVWRLNKRNHFVRYVEKNENINFNDNVDFIDFNTVSNEINIFSNHGNNGNENHTVNFGNMKFVNNFFSYLCEMESEKKIQSNVVFDGLQDAFCFLKDVGEFVVDVDEIMKIYSIKVLYKNSEIIKEDAGNNTIKYYRLIDDGYGEIIKRELCFDNYLDSLRNLAVIYFSVISFSNITTIFLTKKYDFFYELINKDLNIPHSTFKKEDATHPHKILEVIINNYNTKLNNIKDDAETKKLTKETKQILKQNDKIMYLKISPIIFKNINSVSNLNTMYNIILLSIVSKENLEYIFSKFDATNFYSFMDKIIENVKNNNDRFFSFEHIVHMMEIGCQNWVENDYLTLYSDTLRTARLLDMDSNIIFKIKTKHELISLHDDLTAKFNSIKDKKKDEFYKKAVSCFKKINELVIDDVKFSVIQNLELLNKEGVKMHHCIYTYLDSICDGKYIAIHVEHTISNERATAGFYRGSSDKLTFDQFKGYYNSRPSKYLIKSLINYCEDNDITFNHSNSDLQINKSLERKMSDYMSDEKFEDYLLKREKEEAKKHKRKKQTV